MYSADMTLEDIAKTFVRVFTLGNWITDFTFPLMSYLSGNGVKKTIQSIFHPEVFDFSSIGNIG
jgi:hypothetical protein